MSSKTHIILAEDELALGQIIKESLETRNYEVTYCKNGEEAYQAYLEHQPELLVLDVMMPLKDGFTLAKQIREIDNRTPIIFLTAKSQTADVIDGFQHGGNDYLKKPFIMEELIIRMQALLSRVQLQQDDENIIIGEYQFNKIKQTLTLNGKVQDLTHRESQLLFHLSEKRNETLERMGILKKLWGDDDFFNARSMDVFITKLRKKLKDDPEVQIINIRGHGYKLVC